jgi:hypothetical protein
MPAPSQNLYCTITARPVLGRVFFQQFQWYFYDFYITNHSPEEGVTVVIFPYYSAP